MTNKIAVFRATASPEIGGGHIIRCMSLASELSELGWNIIFATEPETLDTFPFLDDHGIIFTDKNNTIDETNVIRESIGKDVSILIVDHYGRQQEFETACREWANNIVVIDDMPTRQHDADLLLDQSGGRNVKDYQNLVPPKCKLLMGPKFSLLRRSFYNTSLNMPYTDRAKRKRVFVSMGASDSNNLTIAALTILEKVCPDYSVDIVLSKSAPHLDEVKSFCSTNENLQLYTGLKNPADVMSNATFAIGTAGINLWERCTLGIPSIIFIAAENQRANANFVIEKGGGLYCGEGSILEPKSLTSAILKLLKDRKYLLQLSTAASRICDGLGASRVAKTLISLNNS